MGNANVGDVYTQAKGSVEDDIFELRSEFVGLVGKYMNIFGG